MVHLSVRAQHNLNERTWALMSFGDLASYLSTDGGDGLDSTPDSIRTAVFTYARYKSCDGCGTNVLPDGCMRQTDDVMDGQWSHHFLS